MEVDNSVVRQVVLCGSHRLYLAVKSIHMTSLLEYLTKNDDASMSFGQGAPQRSYILWQLGNTQSVIFALWPHSIGVHLVNTLSIELQHCVLLMLLSVLGWHVNAHSGKRA